MEPLIYLIREGELSPEEKAGLDRHLMFCEDCRNLYDSVNRMTALIGQSDFKPDRETDEEMTGIIMDRIEKSKVRGRNMDRSNGYDLLWKAVAASLLLFMTLTFIREQTSFNSQRSAMQARLEESALLAGKEDPAADCVRELERKIRISRHSPFLAEATAFNQVNEDQLAQYIHEICEQKTGNVNRVKQMLQQAGVLTNTKSN
ncbi:MAG: zf-HC2 domain-containing protein [Bacteroidales bacterium]|nr:zf-HC2 domain-containing protein [Bacteroidales bacterium]